MSVYIGIDWSEKKHDAVFMNDAGADVNRLTFPHTPDGFYRLDTARRQLQVAADECFIGLETAHNLLVDFLWDAGYTQLYVIPPSMVASSRGRYSASRARTDQSDAFCLADLLRTDRARLHPWQPDSLLTRQLRAKVSLYLHLSRNTVRLSNRLRAVLLRYYPAGLDVFSGLGAQITLEFLQTYPTPQAAAALTWAEFQTFADEHGYRQPKRLPAAFARLQAPHPEAPTDTVTLYQAEAPQLAGLLWEHRRLKAATEHDLQRLFRQHPDAPIFASLPGAGDFLAPALLTKFGDDRQRFPMPQGLQALAGTCPVTEQSGKRKVVLFRLACDHDFRHIAQQWARHSLTESSWAVAYFATIRPHSKSDSHAYRCLANRWIEIAWKLWQTQQTYDEDYHLRQRAAHSRPRR